MHKALTFLIFGLILATKVQSQTYDSPKHLVIPDGLEVSQIKDHGKATLADLMTRFTEFHAGSPIDKYVIVPLRRDIDDGYMTLQFENAFVQKGRQTGFSLVTRENKVLTDVLNEVGFQEIYTDTLNPATAVKLAIDGAKSVILPRIDIDTNNNGSFTLRVNISVFEVSTGKKIWGDEVASVIRPSLTPEQWVLYIGIGLIGFGILIVIVWFGRMIKAAARPR
jgi:hypothetical protein